MGEIADMMLDGTLCVQCGVFIGNPVGYPVNCGCESDSMSVPGPSRKKPKAKKTIPCAHCPKKFGSPEARDQHTQAAHAGENDGQPPG
jgi:hypothetical protein